MRVHFLTLCSEYVHCFINIFFSDSRTPSWTLLFKFIFSCYCSRLQARWKSQADLKLKNSWRPVVFQNIRAAEARLMACGHFRYLLSYIDPASCSSFYHFVVCLIFDWDQQRCVVKKTHIHVIYVVLLQQASFQYFIVGAFWNWCIVLFSRVCS